MPNSSRKTIFTTISIDKETAALVEKICKRYSLKKSEVVKLAFGYIDKAHINPSEAPESVKSELAKINKRQDDIIRFIRHYEEEQLNPMIRATNSIALRFDAIGKTLETLILSQLETSQEKHTAITSRMFSTTQTTEASRCGLEQMRHVSVSDILWHTLQYFTSCFSVTMALPNASTTAVSWRSR